MQLCKNFPSKTLTNTAHAFFPYGHLASVAYVFKRGSVALVCDCKF